MSFILYNSAKPLNLLFAISNFYPDKTRQLLSNSLQFLFDERLKNFSESKFSIVEFNDGFISIFIGDVKDFFKNDLRKVQFTSAEKLPDVIAELSLQKKFTFFSLKNLKNDEILKFTIICTSGSLEIPQISSFFLNKHKDVDGVVALGVVVKGKTDHDKYVITECMRGITDIAIKHSIPFTSGLINSDSMDVIDERISTSGHNIGKQALQACLDTISLKRKMEIFF